jgi:DNA-binding CsgD family transcriptional regulator
MSGDGVWLHRVAAATGVDEALAAALEAAALGSAPAGAGKPGPAQLMEWASVLSADTVGRERRLLTAAVHRVCAGSLGPSDLWARTTECAPTALRSCALAGRALLEGHRLEAEFHLDRACAHADEEGLAVAAIIRGLRAELCLIAARGGRAVSEAEAGLATIPCDREVERWLTRLLAAGRCYAAGPRAAAETLCGARAVAGQRPSANAPQDSLTRLALGSYRTLAGDPGAAVGDLLPLVAYPDLALPDVLMLRANRWLALAYHLLGGWRQADAHARVATDAQDRPPGGVGAAHAIRALLAAHRAEWDAADHHVRNAHDSANAASPDEAVLADMAQAAIAHARGVLLAGHPALARLAAGGVAARKYRSLWLPLQAEAQVESGSEAEAAAALVALLTEAEQVPYLRVAACRLAARLAERRRDPSAARRHYEAGVSLPAECLVVPFQLGLLEQCYGLLLCGLGATAEGLACLDSAGNRLASAGAIAYARRCAADLAARQHAVNGNAQASVLTERERTVARLVTAGLTNQEAAARLFVSVKTVEYHLAQIYGKLGITSRRQLARYGDGSAGSATSAI